jgi:hypothetical protein
MELKPPSKPCQAQREHVYIYIYIKKYIQYKIPKKEGKSYNNDSRAVKGEDVREEAPRCHKPHRLDK